MDNIETLKEEIAKRNSWLKNAEVKERHYDELRRWFNEMEVRAIQAERERDEARQANAALLDVLHIAQIHLMQGKPHFALMDIEDALSTQSEMVIE